MVAAIELTDDQLQELAEVAKDYTSWEELIDVLRGHARKGGAVLKYPALELEDYPLGSVRDWLVIVLNIFGDVGIREGGLPDRLERKRLLARMCEAMDVTELIAKKRLATLEHGGYLRERFGCVLFPVERLKRTGGE